MKNCRFSCNKHVLHSLRELASTVLLWAMFNIVLMGGRGLFNGLRIRSESWLGQTAL